MAAIFVQGDELNYNKNSAKHEEYIFMLCKNSYILPQKDLHVSAFYAIYPWRMSEKSL